MKSLFVLLLLFGLFSKTVIAGPPWKKIVIPNRGFWQLTTGDSCAVPDSANWQFSRFNKVKIAVLARGPEGSGHYWQIFIGLAQNDETRPSRGICLETSTIGWRNRRLPDDSPLFWLNDLNNDSKPELIIWDSQPLSSDSIHTAFTLVAWVFAFDGVSTFLFQEALSKKLNARLVSVQRKSRLRRRTIIRKRPENSKQKGVINILDSLIREH